MKEPLVGTPLFSVLVFERSDGLVPHWITAVQVNVSPKSAPGNVKLSVMLTKFLLALSVMTPLLRVNPFTPVPSVAVICTFTKIVSLFGFWTPNFHVCTPPVFESDSLWVHSIWLKLGSAHAVVVLSGHPVVGGPTVTGTVTVWESVPLVPVTFTL